MLKEQVRGLKLKATMDPVKIVDLFHQVQVMAAKIKVTERVDKDMERLYSKRSELRNKEDKESKKQLKGVEKELDEKYAEAMQKKIQ